uniref:Uncharacterized protein n=1 Tax=Physcomitrium patens TaxID=3218 RepID=A0A2K1ITV8_PHYPA|nr:hypothetical protein PHYPA_024653 [Physcomitrium patens]
MGMCALYSFKYGPRTLTYDGVDSPCNTAEQASILGRKQSKGDANRYDQHPALWKRTIPKGKRCDPPNFSGVILYDENGNRLHPYATNHYAIDRPSAVA